MNQKEKRKLENQLVACGLTNLEDPEFLNVFAALIDQFPGDKHWFLQGLINECEPEKRYEMYQGLAPRIRSFKPMSLDTYTCRIAEEAGAAVSRGHMRVEGDAPKPIEIGGFKLMIVPKSEADAAVATVHCHRCPKTDQFLADTPAGAMIEARKAGWSREKGVNKEICPACSEALAATMVRLANGESLAVYDRRACKLDA